MLNGNSKSNLVSEGTCRNLRMLEMSYQIGNLVATWQRRGQFASGRDCTMREARKTPTYFCICFQKLPITPDNDILNKSFFIVLKREKHKQSHHTIMDTKRMEIRQ